MKRLRQPFEVGACHVFLTSDDSGYISGQTLHPNGGDVVNAKPIEPSPHAFEGGVCAFRLIALVEEGYRWYRIPDLSW